MASIRKTLRIALAVLVALLRVWYRAVLAVPEVKRRKKARRASRRA